MTQGDAPLSALHFSSLPFHLVTSYVVNLYGVRPFSASITFCARRVTLMKNTSFIIGTPAGLCHLFPHFCFILVQIFFRLNEDGFAISRSEDA